MVSGELAPENYSSLLLCGRTHYSHLSFLIFKKREFKNGIVLFINCFTILLRQVGNVFRDTKRNMVLLFMSAHSNYLCRPVYIQVVLPAFLALRYMTGLLEKNNPVFTGTFWRFVDTHAILQEKNNRSQPYLVIFRTAQISWIKWLFTRYLAIQLLILS